MTAHWIALQWRLDACVVSSKKKGADQDTPIDLNPDAMTWWALRFTPHVVWVEEALLLEVSTSLRLWGGQRALLSLLQQTDPQTTAFWHAEAATSLLALARLRWRVEVNDQQHRLEPPPPGALPLHTLSAARVHLSLLARLGCRVWADAMALPRPALARRLGPELGRALDVALGRCPDVWIWATLPPRFAQHLELPTRLDHASALLWSANRLLMRLQQWLQARQLGVLAVEWRWRLDGRKVGSSDLPSWQSLTIRTAEPVQCIEHLRHLLAERLAHTRLLAPALALALRALQTVPWQPGSVTLLPDEQRTGEDLHVFVERVGARLGLASVQRPAWRADHRPECRQHWQNAQEAMHTPAAKKPNPTSARVDALLPTWLLRPPRSLPLEQGLPCFDGAVLQLLAPMQRVESGWWPDEAEPSAPAARDYFLARAGTGPLLWIYRERPTTNVSKRAEGRWFLQGVYG